MRLLSTNYRSARRQQGLGLVELMVGLTLGLLVTLAASTVFMASRQMSRTTDGLGRMQESARSAFELMSREIRETGGNPCDSGLSISNVVNAAQTVPPTWWADWDTPITGYDGATAFPGAAVGAGVGQRVAGTDAVSVKYAADIGNLTVVSHNAAAMTLTVNNNPHRLQAGELMLVCSYGQGAIAQASSVTANTIVHDVSAATLGNCSSGLGLPVSCTPAAPNTLAFPAGAKIGRYVGVGWYVGNNGRAATGGRSLFRTTWNGPEEVAEGVDDMQLTYLVTGAAAYVVATAITDWSTVIGVRVTLTLRSTQNGEGTAADTRLQRPMTYTLSIRNRQP